MAFNHGSQHSKDFKGCSCTDLDDCTNLHLWYFYGGLAGSIGASIVIISYLFTPKLRYHPAVLIFVRAISDLALGVSFLSLEFLDVQHLDCDDGCTVIGNLNLFLFLCSIGSYVALLFDLYQSIKNPFSLPKTRNIRFTVGILIGCALAMSLVVQSTWTYSYRKDLQFCNLSKFSEEENSINPYAFAFIYTPMIAACLMAIYVTIIVTSRLVKGLPS